MNKPELIKKTKALMKQALELKKSNDFLIKQQKEFKAMAERAGSEKAEWKHKALRLEDKIVKLESEIDLLKQRGK